MSLGRRAGTVLALTGVILATGWRYGAGALADLIVVLMFWSVSTGGRPKDFRA